MPKSLATYDGLVYELVDTGPEGGHTEATLPELTDDQLALVVRQSTDFVTEVALDPEGVVKLLAAHDGIEWMIAAQALVTHIKSEMRTATRHHVLEDVRAEYERRLQERLHEAAARRDGFVVDEVPW